jgi:hypothetical protein
VRTRSAGHGIDSSYGSDPEFSFCLSHPQSFARQHRAKPYDEQIRLTWAKRDLAQSTLNAMHEIMQTSSLQSAGDQELFARVLTGYAGFTHYVDAAAAIRNKNTRMAGVGHMT